MSLSVLIITKDEERNIRACLDTVRWADEIIVVDAESGDRTVEIVRQYTDHVLVRSWRGFGPQKNIGIERATGEWLLIVDADERVTNGLREEILAVTGEADPEVAGYEIPRRNFFYGRWVLGGGMYPDYQLRLFRRAAGRYDDTALHERLSLRGKILRLKSPLDHHSMPTIQQHVRKMMRYTTLGAQEKLKERSRVTLVDIGGNHLGTVVKTYLTRGAFRDGVHGVIVSLFAGMHTFVKYAKAWEQLHRQNEGAQGHREL